MSVFIVVHGVCSGIAHVETIFTGSHRNSSKSYCSLGYPHNNYFELHIPKSMGLHCALLVSQSDMELPYR